MKIIDFDKKGNVVRFYLGAARRELQQNKYDAILSTSGPFTAHKIAEKLHSEFRLPWVADYRDLWSQRDYRSFAVSSERMWLEQKYESRIIQSADVLTTVSKPLADDLEQFHRKKTEVIFNGFDPASVTLIPTSVFCRFDWIFHIFV